MNLEKLNLYMGHLNENLNPGHPLLGSMEEFFHRYFRIITDDGLAALNNMPAYIIDQIAETLNGPAEIEVLSTPHGLLLGAIILVSVSATVFFNWMQPIMNTDVHRGNGEVTQHIIEPLLTSYRGLLQLAQEHTRVLRRVIRRNDIGEMNNPLMFTEEGPRSPLEVYLYADQHRTLLDEARVDVCNIRTIIYETYHDPARPMPEAIISLLRELEGLIDDFHVSINQLFIFWDWSYTFLSNYADMLGTLFR